MWLENALLLLQMSYIFSHAFAFAFKSPITKPQLNNNAFVPNTIRHAKVTSLRLAGVC